MKTYIVWFEIFGKKMKTKVKADTMTEARQIIQNKIIFHNIKEQDIFDIMNDIDKVINK